MSLTNEELMRPRWEVISDYPGSPNFIGQVLSVDQNWPDKYPAIFKRLEWWERRKVDDMPKFVTFEKCINVTPVRKAHSWSIGLHGRVSVNIENFGWLISRSSLNTMLPSTEEEYNAYRASLK